MTDAVARLSVALADRYVLERELGSGGMATVYLARDVRHDRRVALKVLRPELAAALGTERFLQEIRTTARLQHPHILPLFDSGTAAPPDGGAELLFYVMPYVEGETLRARLNREKQLGIDAALHIATTIAGALDFAHQCGIVHRDIKPENVLLQHGVPLVADFGIALAACTAGGDRLTETGFSLGTPAYMSPEQAAGDRELDRRSDVYALACLTYEMLAGDPPFVASNPAALIARHLVDTPPPITTVRRNVSEATAAALARALSKAPGDRHGSAGEFAAALLVLPGGTPAPVTVVVLPFVNRSQDPENEYFSDGLTEEIIADLSKVRALRVISRNSAMALKGTTKDSLTLARELGASHIVTGSVRRAGDALRVTAELVEATAVEAIWSEKYGGTIGDVFGIQEAIARKVVGALKMTLTETESRQVAARPVADTMAYDCYLRARQLLYSWTPDAPRRAVGFVDEAMAIVGETPLLLALKAQLQWNAVNLSFVTPDVGLPPALDSLERALALDPHHPLAIFVRGLVAGGQGRPEHALPDLYHAHDQWPGDANILVQVCRYSNTAGLRGHGGLVDRLTMLDPLSPVPFVVAGTYHWLNGRFADAVEPSRRAIALAPPRSLILPTSAVRLAAAGLRDEAVATMERSVREFEGTPMDPAMRFLTMAVAGDRERALEHIGPTTESFTQSELAALFTADAFAMIGQHADAFRLLRRSVDLGFINFPFLAEHDPFLADLRRDPGFTALLAEVKPRWEAALAWEAKRIG